MEAREDITKLVGLHVREKVGSSGGGEKVEEGG